MKLEIDLRDDTFRANPYPVYAALREHAPVYWSEQMGYWLVTRYDDVAGLLRASDTCTSDSFWDRPISHHDATNSDEAYVVNSFSTAMIFHDPPAHTRQRRTVSKAFTPTRVAARQHQIELIARALLDDARQRGEFDFMADFAAPLPILMIADLLGIPVEDRDQVREASDQFASLFEPMLSDEDRHHALHDSAELARYLDEIVAQRRVDTQRRPDLGTRRTRTARRRSQPDGVTSDAAPPSRRRQRNHHGVARPHLRRARPQPATPITPRIITRTHRLRGRRGTPVRSTDPVPYPPDHPSNRAPFRDDPRTSTHLPRARIREPRS